MLKLSEIQIMLWGNLWMQIQFLALRGIRTLDIRLKKHMNSAIIIAKFLQVHPAIKNVFYPALETSKDYALWKRDFTGASGLFSFTLNNACEEQIKKFIDSLSLLKIGFSWGMKA